MPDLFYVVKVDFPNRAKAIYASLSPGEVAEVLKSIQWELGPEVQIKQMDIKESTHA